MSTRRFSQSKPLRQHSASRTPSLQQVNEGVRLNVATPLSPPNRRFSNMSIYSPPSFFPDLPSSGERSPPLHTTNQNSVMHSTPRTINKKYDSNWDRIEAYVQKRNHDRAKAECGGDEGVMAKLVDEYHDEFVYMCDKLYGELRERPYYQHLSDALRTCAYEEKVWYHVGAEQGIPFMGDTTQLRQVKNWYFDQQDKPRKKRRTSSAAKSASLAKEAAINVGIKGPPVNRDSSLYPERYLDHGDADDDDEGGVLVFYLD